MQESASWQQAGGDGGAGRLDASFEVGGNRVADDIVGVLARMERIREVQGMAFLTDIKACQERFKFVEVMRGSVSTCRIRARPYQYRRRFSVYQ